MRLIDSAELIAKLPIVEEDKRISLIGAVADVVTMISECKPVDAVEVVRCKDCIYFSKAKTNQKGFLICKASGMEICDDYFCSYGERRDDE